MNDSMRPRGVFTRSETERTTAATDALLGGVCLALAWRLTAIATPATWQQRLWVGVLLLMASGAILGALAHGLDLGPRSRSALWKPLYLSLGLTVALVIVCAVADWRGEPASKRLLPWAIGAGVGFFALADRRGGGFAFFLAYEGLALLAALAIYGSLAVAGAPGAATIVAGLVLSIIAAAVQLSRWSVRIVVRFDHNGLFHLVQMASVIVIAAGVHGRLTG